MPELKPLTDDLLAKMDAWWRAANYLNIGQIYLMENPLLREPLRAEHIKPRLLGHWGTSPGLNLIYVHLNRLIREYDADIIYMAGPGHGGPALVEPAPIWWTSQHSAKALGETGCPNGNDGNAEHLPTSLKPKRWRWCAAAARASDGSRRSWT